MFQEPDPSIPHTKLAAGPLKFNAHLFRDKQTYVLCILPAVPLPIFVDAVHPT